jgi:hypothetical protein
VQLRQENYDVLAIKLQLLHAFLNQLQFLRFKCKLKSIP